MIEGVRGWGERFFFQKVLGYSEGKTLTKTMFYQGAYGNISIVICDVRYKYRDISDCRGGLLSVFYEYDPRDIGFIALYAAIVWHKELTPEQAIRLAEGKSGLKPSQKLTPELLEEILKIIRNPNFKRFEAIEGRFRISRYKIFEELKRQKVI